MECITFALTKDWIEFEPSTYFRNTHSPINLTYLTHPVPLLPLLLLGNWTSK